MEQRRLRELGSGELAHRRRELGGGGARGGHGLPRAGLGAAGGDRRHAVPGGCGPAAMVGAHGGAPAMESERGQTGKLQRDEGNPFRGLAWAGDGQM